MFEKGLFSIRLIDIESPVSIIDSSLATIEYMVMSAFL